MTTTTSTSRPSCAADPTPPAPPASGAALTHPRPARPWPTRARRGPDPTERPYPAQPLLQRTDALCFTAPSQPSSPPSRWWPAVHCVHPTQRRAYPASVFALRTYSRPAQMFAPRAHIRRQFRARGRGTCAGWWNVRVVVVRARWMRVLVAGVWRVRVRVTRGFSSAFSVRGVSRVLMAGVARWCLRAAQVFVAARVFASRACFRRLFRARGRGTCAGWWNVRVVVVRARGRVSWDLVCGAYLFVRRARFRRPFCARGGGTCAGWWFGRGVAGPGCAACVFV